MTHVIDYRHDKHIRGRVHQLLISINADDTDKVNEKRERFLALLKSRYGYTNEKSVDELQRLLTQFSRINKSLGIRRSRLNYSGQALDGTKGTDEYPILPIDKER